MFCTMKITKKLNLKYSFCEAVFIFFLIEFRLFIF